MLDLPEHGQSIDISFSIQTSAEMIYDVIQEKCANKKVIAIGFSLGAQVLIQLLSTYPNLIHYAMFNNALVLPNKKSFKMDKIDD